MYKEFNSTSVETRFGTSQSVSRVVAAGQELSMHELFDVRVSMTPQMCTQTTSERGC